MLGDKVFEKIIHVKCGPTDRRALIQYDWWLSQQRKKDYMKTHKMLGMMLGIMVHTFHPSIQEVDQEAELNRSL